LYTDFQDFEKYAFPDGINPKDSYSGNNHKSILVLCHKHNLSTSNVDFLKKILSAKNIDLNEDTLLLKLDEAEVNISRLIREKRIKHILYFGIQPKQTGINVQWKLYQKFYLGEFQALVSHNLDDLIQNQQFKKNLWGQLKSWEF
jgi:hypothetical protein